MQNGLSFKNTMSRVGLCYFVLMLVTQALQLAGMTLLGSLLETGWGLWALSYAPLYCIAVPVFILLLQKLVPGTPGTAGQRRADGGRMAALAGAVSGRDVSVQFRLPRHHSSAGNA